MKIEGVAGSIKTGPYRGWIELQSAQIGSNRHVTNPTGQNREAAVPSVSEIVVTKFADDSSTALLRSALRGKGTKVTIEFVREDGSPYLQIEMEDCLISNYTVSGHGGTAESKPMESLSL